MASAGDAGAPAMQPLRCGACRHYRITHDRHFPFGCEAFHFKTRRAPCLDVQEADGSPCRLFEPKAAQKPQG
jgi:hypothetical protein